MYGFCVDASYANVSSFVQSWFWGCIIIWKCYQLSIVFFPSEMRPKIYYLKFITNLNDDAKKMETLAFWTSHSCVGYGWPNPEV